MWTRTCTNLRRTYSISWSPLVSESSDGLTDLELDYTTVPNSVLARTAGEAKMTWMFRTERERSALTGRFWVIAEVL
jgi:hypothetical protein